MLRQVIDRPDRRREPHRCRLTGRAAAVAAVLCTTGLAPVPVWAGDGATWSRAFWANVWNPWFVFGMVAQGVFFMRFVIQWIVSERRRESTIPVSFWYLSLIGALGTFVYAVGRADPVIMIAQLLACFIYIRNLMLIHNLARRRRLAGLPVPGGPSRSGTTGV